MSAEKDVLDRNKDTKEDVHGDNPEQIMNDKPGVLIHLYPEELVEGDESIIQEKETEANKEVGIGLLDVEDVPLMFSSKLGKSSPVQVLTLYIASDDLHKPEPQYSKHSLSNKLGYSLLQVGFSELKIHPQAYLPLGTIFRESSPNLLGKWKNPVAVSNQSYQENPVEFVEQLQICLSICYQSSIRILYKDESGNI